MVQLHQGRRADLVVRRRRLLLREEGEASAVPRQQLVDRGPVPRRELLMQTAADPTRLARPSRSARDGRGPGPSAARDRGRSGPSSGRTVPVGHAIRHRCRKLRKILEGLRSPSGEVEPQYGVDRKNDTRGASRFLTPLRPRASIPGELRVRHMPQPIIFVMAGAPDVSLYLRGRSKTMSWSIDVRGGDVARVRWLRRRRLEPTLADALTASP